MTRKKLHCSICDIDESTALYQKNGYDIVQCDSCGLIHVHSVPSEFNPTDFYSGESYRPKKSWHRRIKMRSIIWLIERYALRKGAFLDVGCSQGDFGLAVKDNKDWVYHGIELHKGMLAYARSLGLNVKCGDLDAMNFPNDFFALITTWHVIEHVENPKKILQEAYKILMPYGLLALQTPNIGHRRARSQGSKWKQIGPPGHLWYFTPHHMRKLLESVGFTVVFEWSSMLKTNFTMFARKPMYDSTVED